MRRAALMWAALAAIVASAGVATSGADFTAGSQSPGNTFVTAADFNTVTVSMTDPGTPLRGRSRSRPRQPRTAGSPPCSSSRHRRARARGPTPASTPWRPSPATGTRPAWSTARATCARWPSTRPATSASPASSRPASSTTRCRSGTLSDPGIMQGTEALTATASDVGSGLASLAISYRPAGGSLDDALLGRDLAAHLQPEHRPARRRQLRAAGPRDGRRRQRARHAPHADGRQHRPDRVDRAARRRAGRGRRPSRSTPPTPARGVATVTAEFRPMAGGAWSQVCVDSAAPWECTGLDTTQAPDGLYEARAIAVDGAGRSTTSASVTNIRDRQHGADQRDGHGPGHPVRWLQGDQRHRRRRRLGDRLLDAPVPHVARRRMDRRVQRHQRAVQLQLGHDRRRGRPATTCARSLVTVPGTRPPRRPWPAAAWTTPLPAVALANPGTPMNGTEALTATATDAIGVASVVLPAQPGRRRYLDADLPRRGDRVHLLLRHHRGGRRQLRPPGRGD